MAYCENGRHRNSVGIAVLPIYVRFFATHFLVSMKNGTTFPISCHPLSCLGISKYPSKMICQSHFKGAIHQRIQSPNISKRSGTKKCSILFQCSYRDHHFQWANLFANLYSNHVNLWNMVPQNVGGLNISSYNCPKQETCGQNNHSSFITILPLKNDNFGEAPVFRHFFLYFTGIPRSICPMRRILMEIPRHTKTPAIKRIRPTWSTKFRIGPHFFGDKQYKKWAFHGNLYNGLIIHWFIEGSAHSTTHR